MDSSVFDVRRPFRAKERKWTPQNRNFTLQFLTFDVHFVRKGWNGHLKIAILPCSFWRSTSISCERVEMDTSKSQFYLAVFDVRRPFRAKELKWTPQNRNFTLQFLTFDVHFVRKSWNGHLKIAILPQFLTFDVHFVRKGWHGHLIIAILPCSFWRSTSISRERVEMDTQNRNFTLQFLTFNVHFVRKSWNGHLKIAILPYSFWRSTSISCERVEMDTSKSQFYLAVFDVRRPFRAKGLKWTPQNRNFTLQFLTFDVHFVRKGWNGHLKIAILPQFLTFDVHFVRKGWNGHLKIAILPCSFWRSTSISCERAEMDTSKSQFYLAVFDVRRPFRAKGLKWTPHNRNFTLQFLTFDLHFVRKGCVSWRFGGPAPVLERKKERRARGRHTVRERREKICRHVKM